MAQAMPNIEELEGLPAGPKSMPSIEELELAPKATAAPMPSIEEIETKSAPAPKPMPSIEEMESGLSPHTLKMATKVKKFEKNKVNYDLNKQGMDILLEAKKLTAPGTGEYSKNEVMEALSENRPPIGLKPKEKLRYQAAQDKLMGLHAGTRPTPTAADFSEDDQRIFHMPDAMLTKEEQARKRGLRSLTITPLQRHQGGIVKGVAKAGGKVLGTSMDVLDAVFNAPIRPLTETFDTMRKAVNWYAEGMKGEPPEWHPIKALFKQDGASRGFSDFFTNSYRQMVGGRELNEKEQLALGALGMAYDMGGGASAWRGIKPLQDVSTGEAVQKNMAQVLNKAGVAEDAVHPARTAAAAIRTAAPTGLPQRIEEFRRQLQNIGRMQGMTPSELRALDELAIAQVGSQGKNLGRLGWWPNFTRRFLPVGQQEAADIRYANPLPAAETAPRVGNVAEAQVSNVPVPFRRPTGGAPATTPPGVTVSWDQPAPRPAGLIGNQPIPVIEPEVVGAEMVRGRPRLPATLEEPIIQGEFKKVGEGFTKPSLGWAARPKELMGDVQGPTTVRLRPISQVRPWELQPPFGAQTDHNAFTQLWKRTFNWDVGAPEGAADVVRQEQGRHIFRTAQIEKEAQGIARSFESPERSSQVMRYLDARREADAAQAWHEHQISTGARVDPDHLAEMHRRVQRYEEYGREGWAPRTTEEHDAIRFMRQSYDRIHQQLREEVGDIGHLADFIPRRESAESKQGQVNVSRPPWQTGGSSVGTERMPWTEGTSLEGAPLRGHPEELLGREFTTEPAVHYSDYARGAELLVTIAKTEKDLLQAYGRHIPTRRYFLPAEREAMNARGFWVWEQRYGRGAGREFVVDGNTKQFLDRLMPQKPVGTKHPVVDLVDKFQSWAKGRMLTTSPGWVFRNAVGNVTNQYVIGMADNPVQYFKGLNDAMKVYAATMADDFANLRPVEQLRNRLLFGDVAVNMDEVVAGRPLREWAAEIRNNKVTNPRSQFSYESEQFNPDLAYKRPATILERLNPFGRRNYVSSTMENANRGVENVMNVHTYMWRRNSGFAPWEATKSAAQSLFRADEMSPFQASPVVRRTTAFINWPMNNAGFHLMNMGKNPDQYAKWASLRSGIQNLDPLNQFQMEMASLIPKSMKEGGVFFPPRMQIGSWNPGQDDQGNRKFWLTGKMFSVDAIGQLGLEKLLRGDVKDFGRGILKAYADLLAPIPGFAYKTLVRAQTGYEPTAFGQAQKTTGEEMDWAPKPMLPLILAAKANATTWDWVNGMGWFAEVKDEKGSTIGYKVNRDFVKAVDSLDPFLGRLGRMFPGFQPTTDYDATSSFFFLTKSISLNEDRVKKYQSRQQRETLDRMKTLQKRQENTGENKLLNPLSKYRGIVP